MNEFAGIVSQVGFPIIAFFLMYRLVVDTIRKSTQALDRLTNILNQFCIERKIDEVVKKIADNSRPS